MLGERGAVRVRRAPGSSRRWLITHTWHQLEEAWHANSKRLRGLFGSGHYTQIVWRSTVEVGCAVARSGLHEVWVCRYSPPGNVVGQRPY